MKKCFIKCFIECFIDVSAVVLLLSVFSIVTSAELFAQSSSDSWDDRFALAGIDFRNNRIYSIVTNDSSIYVAGSFSNIGSSPSHGLSRWNGRQWDDLGTTVNTRRTSDGTGNTPAVNALALDSSGNLYALGNFDSINGVAIYRAAMFDGNRWHDISSGFPKNGWVKKLVKTPSLLVAVGENLFDGVAAYDGCHGKPLDLSAIRHSNFDCNCKNERPKKNALKNSENAMTRIVKKK